MPSGASHMSSAGCGVYDRQEFYSEKKAAFEALASQIDRILQPADNVVPLRTPVPG